MYIIFLTVLSVFIVVIFDFVAIRTRYTDPVDIEMQT